MHSSNVIKWVLFPFGIFFLINFSQAQEGINCDPADPTTWGKLYANPENFSTYWECTPSGLQLFACPEGLFFPIDGEYCDWPFLTSTPLSTIGTTPTITSAFTESTMTTIATTPTAPEETTTTNQSPTSLEPTISTDTESPITEATIQTTTIASSTTKPPSTTTVFTSSTTPQPSTTPPTCFPCTLSIHYENVTWLNAGEACATLGKELVTVLDLSKWSCVLDLIHAIGLSDTSHYWTGGNDIGEEGSFTWYPSLLPLTQFYPTTSFQPTSQLNENCVGIRKHFDFWDELDYIMTDEICSKLFYYICE